MVHDLAEVKSNQGPPRDWLRLSQGPAKRLRRSTQVSTGGVDIVSR